MGNLSKYKLPRKNGGRLLIVIAAVLLLELLSVAQYYLTHNLLEEELEKRAELELTMKTIILKKIIDDSERTLKSHIMEVKYNLSTPDSLYNIMKQIAKYSPLLKGCGIAFDPNYYEDRGVLFEPYALRTDSGFRYMDAAAEAFDYTKNGFYKGIKERKGNSWVGPYDDVFLKRRLISYAVPIYEFSGDTIAVLGVDIDTYSLGDTLNRRHIYPSSFDFLLTAEGELIAGPSDSAMQKDLQELVSIMADSTVTREKSYTGRTTMIDVEINGRKGSLFYASMRSYPNWQVAVVCYDDEVYASLMQLRFRLLLLSFVAFGVLLFLVFRFWAGEKELHIKKLEQERIDGELRIASNIQQSLLPEHESSLSGVSEISVEGRLIPAKAVGGDLYNAFVRDGKLFFCIGDVSGKGVPCALIMAITQALFRDIASRESNPAHIMKRLNEMACRNNKANIFVTLFIGVLDLPTGNLHYCNAGHELPIFIDHSPLNIDHSPLTVDHSATPGAASERSDGQPSEARVRCSFIEAKPNLPIGLFDDFQFEMQTMTLKPGDAFFLYTDGLTEARSADNKLFGRERVVEMITRCGMSDPKQDVAGLPLYAFRRAERAGRRADSAQRREGSGEAGRLREGSGRALGTGEETDRQASVGRRGGCGERDGVRLSGRQNGRDKHTGCGEPPSAEVRHHRFRRFLQPDGSLCPRHDTLGRGAPRRRLGHPARQGTHGHHQLRAHRREERPDPQQAVGGQRQSSDL